MNFHFLVIANDFDCLERNTATAVSGLIKKHDNVFLKIVDNRNFTFKDIRSWINFELNTLYKNNFSEDDLIFFLHQDVFIFNDFIDRFIEILKTINIDSIGVIGFAGIDKRGNEHLFIKDSGEFRFTLDMLPCEVETVDEFLFCLNYKQLFKEKILLSDIDGWHAYSAEFSLLFSKKGYKTYFFPIFVEHNSIRINNKGLYHTHDQLFKKYNTQILTLVGIVDQLSLKRRITRFLYAKYVENVKFKYNSHFFNKLKTFFLDRLNLNFSVLRFIQNFIDGKEVYFLFFANEKHFLYDIPKIQCTYSIIHFFVLSDINQIKNFQDGKPIILFGFDHELPPFKFINRAKINVSANNPSAC